MTNSIHVKIIAIAVIIMNGSPAIQADSQSPQPAQRATPPTVFAPKVCRSSPIRLEGRLPQDVRDTDVTVEYNYKPTKTWVAIDHKAGDFFLELPDLGAHGAMKIDFGKTVPYVILNLDDGIPACPGADGLPSVQISTGPHHSADPRPVMPETPYDIRSSPVSIVLSPPTAGADSVTALVVGELFRAIELHRTKPGLLPDQGEKIGWVSHKSVSTSGEATIELDRGITLAAGDMIFAKSGPVVSPLVTVTAKAPSPVTTLDPLHSGQSTITGFTQCISAKSVSVFINGSKAAAGTTDASFTGAAGKFSITLSGGAKVSHKDRVSAKPDGCDPSLEVLVERGLTLPLSAAPQSTSNNATVHVDPLKSADSDVISMAAPGANVSLLRGGIVTDSKKAGADGVAEFAIPATNPLHPRETVTVCTGDQAALNPDDCATAEVKKVRRDGEQFRAVVGFAQSGSANANNSNKFFLDFYVSRPISRAPDPAIRWWGNVRIASKPVDGTSFSGLAAAAKGLKTNELAQAAEYLSGLDIRLSQIKKPLLGQSEDSRQRFVLSFVAAGGAAGTLTNQTSAPSLYLFPKDAGSQDALIKFYPSLGSKPSAFAVKSPDERYALQYWAGFRVTTRYADQYGAPLRTPPAMVSFVVGQSQAVTPGLLRGVVGRLETFYPMLTHNANPVFGSLYLFGTAQLRMGGARFPALSLAVPSAMDTSIIPSGVPNIFDRVTRDQYSIGVGLDLVNVLSRAKISFK